MTDPPDVPPLINERAAIAALTVLAAALRLADFGRLGIDHFDEGMYAAAGAWSLAPGGLGSIDPGLIPYAPPGYIVLVGLAYWGLGVAPSAAIIVSILAGVATIPVVAWLARRAFTPGAGVAAAAIGSLAGLHVAFSRMALTDATLLLVWTVALGLGGRFLERPSVGRALAFGLAVGLAQLTKYNGWLAGAIVAATGGIGLLVDREERTRQRAMRLAWSLGLAGAAAAVVYGPWFAFVERHGGYSALLAHQRSYLGSVRAWPSHLATGCRQVAALGGFTGSCAVGVALAAIGVVLSRRRPPRAASLGQVVVLALILGPQASGWWVGLGLTPWLMGSRSAAIRLIAVWWVTLTALTPLYHPYARLWLPLEAAGWCLSSALIVGAIGDGPWPRLAEAIRARPIAAGWVALCLVGGWVQATIGPHRPVILPGVYGPRDSLRVATSRLFRSLGPGVTSLDVLGRPPLRLDVAGRRVTPRVVEGVGGLLRDDGESWAIVDEVQLAQEGPIGPNLDRLRTVWTVVAREPAPPWPATRLDVDPSAAFGQPALSDPSLLLLHRNRERVTPR